ncbi:hypothetical protein B0H19DRAFT_1191466 [Mycena capillaripes]|nr:hypothetical protein B0H19DRAFT_1191466 [Mycena capillaripes]
MPACLRRPLSVSGASAPRCNVGPTIIHSPRSFFCNSSGKMTDRESKSAGRHSCSRAPAVCTGSPVKGSLPCYSTDTLAAEATDGPRFSETSGAGLHLPCPVSFTCVPLFSSCSCSRSIFPVSPPLLFQLLLFFPISSQLYASRGSKWPLNLDQMAFTRR